MSFVVHLALAVPTPLAEDERMARVSAIRGKGARRCVRRARDRVRPVGVYEIADAAGNLFGTTAAGGADGDGAVFEIAKTKGGYASAPTTLVTFTSGNGVGPQGNLAADSNGNFFGATFDGGPKGVGRGAVFEVIGSGFLPYRKPPRRLGRREYLMRSYQSHAMRRGIDRRPFRKKVRTLWARWRCVFDIASSKMRSNSCAKSMNRTSGRGGIR